jgi:hypothetical protein
MQFAANEIDAPRNVAADSRCARRPHHIAINAPFNQQFVTQHKHIAVHNFVSGNVTQFPFKERAGGNSPYARKEEHENDSFDRQTANQTHISSPDYIKV